MDCWSFESTPKISQHETRSVPLARTDARLAEVRRLVPISRLTDLTPLDPLRLPVFSATTPLALDLTLHMGKGTTPLAARVSAQMEAIERVCAEQLPDGVETARSAFVALRGAADPFRYDLPDDTHYAPFRDYTWVRSQELLRREPIWMATDLVICPPREGILHAVDTNGLASGNNHLEAVVHALCEVIERDVLSQHEFLAAFGDEHENALACHRIDPRSLPDAAGSWYELLRSNGLQVAIEDLTGDVGVATLRCTILDPQYPTDVGPMTLRSIGFGTHPDRVVAVLRAMSEAVQSRVGTIQAARDSYNRETQSKRSATQWARLTHLSARELRSFDHIPTHETADLHLDLDFLLQRLCSIGVDEVVASDLSDPRLGFAVVRVRVAGLASFIVNARRVGWRCRRHIL